MEIESKPLQRLNSVSIQNTRRHRRRKPCCIQNTAHNKIILNYICCLLFEFLSMEMSDVKMIVAISAECNIFQPTDS